MGYQGVQIPLRIPKAEQGLKGYMGYIHLWCIPLYPIIPSGSGDTNYSTPTVGQPVQSLKHKRLLPRQPRCPLPWRVPLNEQVSHPSAAFVVFLLLPILSSTSSLSHRG